jgi:SAM-dependent methyltransferase
MREELQDEHIDALCLEARGKGWEKAVADRYGSLDKVPWIADLSRADALLFSKINSDSMVLDLGSRYGVLSFALAPLCSLVASLDHEETYSEFVRIRSQQDEIRNVMPICADIRRTPFKESCFDLIIINKEIIAYTPKDHLDPLFAEVYALLKSEGQVFIGLDRDSSTFPNRFLSHKNLQERLCSLGFEIDKVIIPLKKYHNFKFLIDCAHKPHFQFLFNLIIRDYAVTPIADKIYRMSAAIVRYGGLTELLRRSFLFNSYLIFARKS